MASFLEGLTNGLRSAYCAIGGLPPDWIVDAYRGLTPGAIQDIGSRLNRAICNDPPGENYPSPAPFSGGQCPVAYSGTYSFQSVNTDGSLTAPVEQGFSNILGPIAGIVRRGSPGNYQAFLIHGGGLETFLRSSSAPQGGLENLKILTTSRDDGQPDNCGDPGYDPAPPQPITTPVDITYEGDDNVEYNITVPVTFAPVYVKFDGTVRIPITIGDLNFKGELVIAPKFELEVQLPEIPGGPRPDNPQLPPPDDVNNGEPDSDSGPEGTIVGVLVRSSQNGPVRSTTLFMESMPDIVAPRCATVRFLCRFGSIRAWTTDQPVKGVNEYVPCPSPFGAIDVKVTPETNWEVSSTAIRSRPPAIFDP